MGMQMQSNLDLFTGLELKNNGMSVAIQHADLKHDGWSEKAYSLLKQYIRIVRGSFLCEDVRAYAELHGLPTPPSNRAWGSLVCKAKREGLIKCIGTRQVNNPRAHMANASCWMAIK